MEITVISIVLGFVIVTVCLGLPQLVRVRTQRPDEDAYGYLKRLSQPSGDNSPQDAACPGPKTSRPARSRRSSEADRS